MFMPLFTLWIIFNYNPYVTFNIPKQLHLLIFGIVGVYTLLIPLLSSVILKKMNLISNYEMNDRNERKLPFLIAGFSFFFCYYMLQKYPALIIISLIMLGATIAMLATVILNYKFKISAHMIGIGGLIGSIAGLTILLGINISYFSHPDISLCGSLKELNLAYIIAEWAILGSCICIVCCVCVVSIIFKKRKKHENNRM
jgi:hypothetical protein